MLRLLAVLLTLAAGCASAPLRTVTVDTAPKAIGPYSQAVIANGFVYTAGFTPRDPATDKQPEGDMAMLTNRVFDSLEAVLAGAGCTLQDVVKVTVFMTDLAEFAKMNEAYAARFGSHRPARSTVQVARLPGGARIEIEMVARLPRR